MRVRVLMAGRPKLNETIDRIETSPGGWESIFDAIADGASVRDVARSYGISASFFYDVLRHGEQGAEHMRKLALAREYRAETRADEALHIVDNARETPAAVNKAAQRAKIRQWLASVDSERYRRASGVPLELNVNVLHLDALKRRAEAASLPPTRDALPAEYEVVLDENEHVERLGDYAARPDVGGLISDGGTPS